MMEDSRIRELAQRFGTPLYLYDKQLIKEQYDSLKACIFPGAELFYSMKANPALGICRVYKELGASVEVASAGELCAAIKAGFDPQSITFTSPGKTKREMEYALKHKIRLIHVESLEEARLLNETAKELGVSADIGVRINPAASYSNAKIKMSGVSSQFGIEEADMTKEIFDGFQSFSNLILQGIQVYMGTQMLQAEDIIKNTEYIMDMALRMSDEFGFALRYLNVGGGFGVKYFKNEQPLDLATLKNGMAELETRFGEALAQTKVVFESGRFLMAEAGVFVTKVLYVKESKGQKFIVCDGGSNFHSSAAFLGRFVRNNFPMHTIPDGSKAAECTVCGPLCTALDVIGQKVALNADIAPDDLVVIEKSGAYGYTYSLCKFLSHEQPAEVLIDGESAVVIRERGIPEDVLSGQSGIS